MPLSGKLRILSKSGQIDKIVMIDITTISFLDFPVLVVLSVKYVKQIVLLLSSQPSVSVYNIIITPMYYQSSEEVHELLMSCGNRPETVVCSEIEPLQALCRAQRTLPCPGVSHFGLDLLQLLFNAE